MAKKRIKIKNDCRPKIPKFSKIGAKVGGNSKFSFSWWKFYFKFSNSSGLLLNFQLKEFETINFLKLESEMKNLKPGSMSRLMWSLGRLNIMPSQNFLTIFYDQFAKLGTECKAQDVALCMEGIVKLGLKPNQRFFFTYSGVFPFGVSKSLYILALNLYFEVHGGMAKRCNFKDGRNLAGILGNVSWEFAAVRFQTFEDFLGFIFEDWPGKIERVGDQCKHDCSFGRITVA